MTIENEKAIGALLEAHNEKRFADFGAGYTEDAEIVYSQSGERIVGRTTSKPWSRRSPPLRHS